jgi:Na+/H+-dicarboxylate symporter
MFLFDFIYDLSPNCLELYNSVLTFYPLGGTSNSSSFGSSINSHTRQNMFTNFLITILWVSIALAIYLYLAIWAFILFVLVSVVSFFAFALVQSGSFYQEPLE